MVIDTHRKKHPLMLGVMMFINASRHEGYHWFLQLVSKPLALHQLNIVIYASR